jgi:hypothetical protein
MKLNSIAYSFALGALFPAVLATVARGQSGGPFDLSWSTIHGGGGTSVGSTGGADTTTSSQFTLTGTIGQPDAGIATLRGGQFSLTGGFWSFLSVVQTPGAPSLEIKLVGASAVLSWPLNMSGFFLQETPSLSASIWTSTPQSVVDTATEHTVTVPATGLMKCFRLKHP